MINNRFNDLEELNNAIKEKCDKSYNKGLEDAWELARKIFTTDCATLQKALGHSDEGYIIMTFEPQEALAKLKAYEKENAIKVGDVVESINTGRIGVITKVEENGKYVIFADGTSGMFAHDDIRKTGKHIDITSVLEQLRGDEYDSEWSKETFENM